MALVTNIKMAQVIVAINDLIQSIETFTTDPATILFAMESVQRLEAAAAAAEADAQAAASAAQNTFSRFAFTATGGETSVSGADDNGNTLSYTVGNECVMLNGAFLVRGIHYTATDGTSITGLDALAEGDVLAVLALGSFRVFGNDIDLGDISGTTQDLDAALAESFAATIDTDAATLTFSGAQDGKMTAFVLTLTLVDGGRPVWPAGTKWDGALAPTLSDGEHEFVFRARSAGGPWTGSHTSADIGVPT